MNKKEIFTHELSALFQKGSITAKQLVDVARDAKSPLHPFFEWNDEVGAERYREIQAGRYLRKYDMVFLSGRNTPEQVFHVPSYKKTGEGEYMPISFLVSRPDEYERAMVELKSYLSAAVKTALDKIKVLEAAAKTDAQKKAALAYRKSTERIKAQLV